MLSTFVIAICTCTYSTDSSTMDSTLDCMPNNHAMIANLIEFTGRKELGNSHAQFAQLSMMKPVSMPLRHAPSSHGGLVISLLSTAFPYMCNHHSRPFFFFSSFSFLSLSLCFIQVIQPSSSYSSRSSSLTITIPSRDCLSLVSYFYFFATAHRLV